MQTLQVVQKSFDLMGFNPKRKPFNHTALSILIITFSGVIVQWIYLFNVSESSQEHMNAIYVVDACTGTFLSLASLIFNTKELFSFINRFNELTNESNKKNLIFQYSKIFN